MTVLYKNLKFQLIDISFSYTTLINFGSIIDDKNFLNLNNIIIKFNNLILFMIVYGLKFLKSYKLSKMTLSLGRYISKI